MTIKYQNRISNTPRNFIKKVVAILSCATMFLIPNLYGCSETKISGHVKKNTVIRVNNTPALCEDEKEEQSQSSCTNSIGVKYIMMHDTEVDLSPMQVAQSWDNANDGYVAAHFVIGKDGTVVQCVPLDTITHHAGYGDKGHNDKFGVSEDEDDMKGAVPIGDDYPDYGMNAHAIGIEMVHLGSESSYPKAQLEAVDKVIKYIDEQVGSQPQIICHKDWRTSNSDTDEDFAEYLKNLQGSNRTTDGQSQSESLDASSMEHHESASFQHGKFKSGEGCGENSGNKTTSSMTQSQNMTKVKDGYKIPGDYTKDKDYHGLNSDFKPGDEQRGKGLFTSEDCWDAESPGWSASHYEVNARWEYVDWGVESNKWPGWSVHGCTDGLAWWAHKVDNEQQAWVVKQHVLVYNAENGKGVVCQVGDGESNANWGPNTLAAVGGLSYQAQEALGFKVGGLDGGDYEASCLDWGGELEMWWVDENTPLGPTTIDKVAEQKQDQCGGEGSSQVGPGVGVEAALKWAESAANDDTVGYSQSDRDSVKDYDGKTPLNSDCSSLIYWGLVKGGGFSELEEASGGYCFYTGNESDILQKCGWKEYSTSGGNAALQRGDIMIIHQEGGSQHTEWYSGDGKFCGAHIGEGGSVSGGARGDQTGDEVSVQNGDASSFAIYLRYEGNKNGGDSSSSSSSSAAYKTAEAAEH